MLWAALPIMAFILTRDGKKLGIGKVLASAGVLFAATRKKYMISIPKFFVPSLPTQQNKPASAQEVIKTVHNAVDISIVHEPELGYRLTLKPIYGVQLPFKVDLPITAPIAIPQIYAQLDKKMIIVPQKVLGQVIGYWVEVKNIEVWM